MHEHPLPPSGDGTVVLDIGGEVGALVVVVPDELEGRELDLFPAGSATPLVHSAVRRRDVVGGTLYAAVYPAVRAGEYTVEGRRGRVRVVGGEVSQVGWHDEPVSTAACC